MKKAKLLALLIAVVMVFSFVLTACQSEFVVSYYSGTTKIGEEKVARGGTASGQVEGWLLSGSLTTEDGAEFDLTQPIKSDVSLYGDFYQTVEVSYYVGSIKIGSETIRKGAKASASVSGYTLLGGLTDGEGHDFDLNTSINENISLYGEFTLNNTWVNDTKEYTWRAGPTQIPTNWNYHTYQANDATYVLDYTSDGLYTFDYNETGDGFQIVPSMASAMPVDVTAQYVGRYGIEEGDTGRVYQISLKHNLKYDNGDGINANSFVRSVQNLLNPAAANFRADNLYKSGNLKIYGAEAYLKQGSETLADVTGGEGVYFAGQDCEWGSIPAELQQQMVFSALNCYVGNYFIENGYFGASVVYKGLSVYLTDGAATEADIQAIDGKTLAQINANPAYKATLDMLLAGWCTDPGEEFGFFCTRQVWGEYSFSDVGFSAVDDYTIQIVLEKPMADDFYLHYELCTSFFLVHNGLYEQCIKTESGVYDNDYATSVEKYAGYGPYKLVEYTADHSFKLARNPYWHGYYEIEHAGQYQTTGIEYKVVSTDTQRLEMFLKGELDSYGLNAADMNDYISSKYTYFQDSESTWFVALNPDLTQYNSAAEKATPVTAGNVVIKSPLTIFEFRQAMSYSLDRTAFIVACNPTSGVAKALLSSMMISDPEKGESYRSTEEAKDAILNFWGLADEVGPGKEYETKDDAIESITGYDPAGAKTLFTKAYQIAREEGYVTEEMHTSGKWELQIMIGATNWQAKFYSNGYDFLSANWIEAVKGTPWEGHLTFVKSGTLGGDDFGPALREGRVDLLFGVGFSGSMFDPYSFMDVFTGSLQYDSCTDKTKIMLDIEVEGKTLRASLYDWVSECLQGNEIQAKVVGADGKVTEEVVKISAGADAETSLRLKIMAEAEVSILNLCNMIPLMTDASASLRCMRIQYKTEEYILGLGRGGIQYYTYIYDDAEFAKFVADQGGTLNYKVTE